MDSARARHHGYQVPYAETIRAEAGIMTTAIGQIVHADQAEAILHGGCADLVALARELLYNPNRALDVAQKLAADPDFVTMPPAMGFWLGKRARAAFEDVPSTDQRVPNGNPRGTQWLKPNDSRYTQHFTKL
jgi:hypothetical protein